MKAQVKTPVIVVAVVAVLGLVIFMGMKTMGDAGSLDHGQIKYTPGKPPWMETDPSKRGPGGAPPGVGGQTAPAQAPNMPVGPPVLGNGK